jgi:DNA-binding IclR family transcriptional regulator
LETLMKWRILDAMVDDVLDTGVCPTAGRVCEVAESPRNTVNYYLAQLAKLGYVRQAYPRGPYVPIKDSDGIPVVIDVRREA